MRLKLAAIAATASLPLCLGACRSVAPPPDEPAWIVRPSPASRAEIERAIHALIGEREIRMSEDALTTSHVLTLEPAMQSRLEGRPLGRNLEAPERFALMLQRGRCFLVHVASGRRERLLETRCVHAGTRAATER